MKRSLTSLAALALGWQVVSAADPVYQYLPPAGSTPAASAGSEFGASYTPISPVRSTMPPAPTPAVVTAAAEPPKAVPATVPPTAPTAEVVPAAASSESTPAPSPLQGGGSAPAPLVSPLATPALTPSPLQASPAPAMPVTPVSAPATLPESVPVTPTNLPPVATPIAPAAPPATLPPASTATPLPALMPPVKNTTPTTMPAAKPATTVTKPATLPTPVVTKPATVVNKPTPATLAPAAPGHNTPASPSIRSQLRDFLGIVDHEEQEQLPAKSEVKKEAVVEHAEPSHGKACTTSCHFGGCNKEFCLGCWCDEHLGCLRGMLDHCNHGCCGGLDGDIIAGVTFYFVQPNFESNPAYFSGTLNAAARSDYRYHLELAPQIWLGYVGNDGLGARVTWWQFDHSSATEAITATATTFVSPGSLLEFFPIGPGDALVTNSSLSLNVWDFEVTQDLRLQHWVLVASGGLRYAHMSQDFLTSVSGPGFPVPAVLTGYHDFNGAGPTIALAARRLLGDSGLALFGMTRGAILFGSGNAASFISEVGEIGGESIESAQSDVLPVLELELGAEYGRAVGDYRLFGQLGFVGQCWFGAGNADSSITSAIIDTGNTDNLGFTGFFVRAGVGY